MPPRGGKLLELGLKNIQVTVPPEELTTKAILVGNELDLPIGGWTCGENSFVLASAAREALPGAEIAIVCGFAFGGEGSGSYQIPSAHVWVRVGTEHYDITWSRYDPTLTGCEYYVAFETAVRRDVLNDVEFFALENCIETL